ncbi:MAG: response regulator [Bacteroidota bacterium]|nr:response regulator [Bacteroidota bacterium]
MANIIIAEDEAIVAMENRLILTGLGHNVIAVVATAEDTLLAFEKEVPDLMLMDIKLKGSMDGIAAIKQIRKKSQIPVIFLTGSSDPKTRAQVNIIPNVSFLLKPVSKKELSMEVLKLLSGK